MALSKGIHIVLCSALISQAAHSIALGCSAYSSLCCFLLCNTMSALRFLASPTVSSFVCRSPMPVDTSPCLRFSLNCVNSLIRSASGNPLRRCRFSPVTLKPNPNYAGSCRLRTCHSFCRGSSIITKLENMMRRPSCFRRSHVVKKCRRHAKGQKNCARSEVQMEMGLWREKQQEVSMFTK